MRTNIRWAFQASAKHSARFNIQKLATGFLSLENQEQCEVYAQINANLCAEADQSVRRLSEVDRRATGQEALYA